MCGIVGAVSTRNIVPILVQGLQRLEYRGYDSCGVAVHADGLKRARSTARVADLLTQVRDEHLEGTHRHRPHALGHARRAGRAQRASRTSATARARAPAAKPGRIALVHNGIIENHEELRAALQGQGLRVQQPDRHRGHLPPDRQPLRRRPVRGGEGRRARSCTAPMRSPCSAGTSRTAWSARAPARR